MARPGRVHDVVRTTRRSRVHGVVPTTRHRILGLLMVPVFIACARHKSATEEARSGSDEGSSSRTEVLSRQGIPEEVEAGGVPLKLELPRPMFIGTPSNIRSSNLEKPRKGRRPDFVAPVGTTNVALGKPVRSSDDEPIIGELSQVTDGDKEGVEGSYVELGPGRQYFQIDLGAKYSVYAVLVWHYHAQARAYHDVVVQLADDPDFTVDVRTVFNNDHDNSSGLGIGKDREYIDMYEGRLIDAKSAKARYVRLYTNGSTDNDMNHCTEVEVYAKE